MVLESVLIKIGVSTYDFYKIAQNALKCEIEGFALFVQWAVAYFSMQEIEYATSAAVFCIAGEPPRKGRLFSFRGLMFFGHWGMGPPHGWAGTLPHGSGGDRAIICYV